MSDCEIVEDHLSCGRFRGKVQPEKMYDSRPKSSLKYVTGSTLGTGAVNGGFYSELDTSSNRGNTLYVCLYNYVCVYGGSQPSISLSICLLYLLVCLSGGSCAPVLELEFRNCF